MRRLPLTWSVQRDRAVLAAIAAVAFVERLVPVLRGGGLEGYGRYDDGVYFAAADALVHGRVPYQGFVLLHPPAIMLVLAPFAELARVVGDPRAHAAARVAFMALGAVNAVLVALLARRWGRVAAVVAGAVYACWHAAVYTEQTTFLEPVATTCVLAALLVLVRDGRSRSWRAPAAAGALLGAAATVKIWYVASVGAVVAWQLAGRRVRTALITSAASAAAAAVVLLPFFVLAPSRMFDMVVRDQLERPAATTSRLGRLPSVVGVRGVVPVHAAQLALTVLVLLLAAAAVVACLGDAAARLVVLVLAADVLVLLASPSYFAHYAALTAPPAAVVAGIGIARARTRAPSIGLPLLAVAAVLVAGSGVGTLLLSPDRRLPASRFAHAAPAGCITSDDPQLLILMNRLSRDLADGCPLPVDVSGITYDALHRQRPNGDPVSRRHNAAFQDYLYRYLTSGSAFVLARKNGEMAPATAARLHRFPVLARSRGVVLRAVR